MNGGDTEWQPGSVNLSHPESPRRKPKRAEAKREKAKRKAAEEVKSLPVLETEKSRALCEEISRISGGTCFLGFSRGKDSIAAWLYLRRFFTRIIPFHCASVPGLGFVNRSLDYYEKFFGVEILRLMDGEVLGNFNGLVYQSLENEAEIDAMELWSYDKHAILDVLRAEYGAPNAWGAFGINLTDSLDRRIYVEKCQGRHDTWKTFYPCWDWTKEQILGIIREAELRLPGDYLLASRTMAGTPSYRHVSRMGQVFPEDLERVALMFPHIFAEMARQEFRAEMPRFQKVGKVEE